MLPTLPIAFDKRSVSRCFTGILHAGDGTQKYRLHISLNVELWLPPGYPTFDFGAITNYGRDDISLLPCHAGSARHG